MPKGLVSAYEAGKVWGVHPDTVKKWISNKSVRGYSKKYAEGLIRYYVYEAELEKVRNRLKMDRDKGKSLFKE